MVPTYEQSERKNSKGYNECAHNYTRNVLRYFGYNLFGKSQQFIGNLNI